MRRRTICCRNRRGRCVNVHQGPSGLRLPAHGSAPRDIVRSESGKCLVCLFQWDQRALKGILVTTVPWRSRLTDSYSRFEANVSALVNAPARNTSALIISRDILPRENSGLDLRSLIALVLRFTMGQAGSKLNLREIGGQLQTICDFMNVGQTLMESAKVTGKACGQETGSLG